MKKKSFLFLALLSLIASFSFANTISLSDAIASAKENNSDLERARYNLQIELRNSSLASSYIPNISLDGEIGIDGSIIGKSFGSGVSGSVGLSIDLGTNLISDRAKKSAEQTIAYIDYALEEEIIEESVTISYLALFKSLKEIDSASISRDRAKESLARLEESYEAGLATTLEKANARYNLQSAEYSLKVLQDTYELALESFKIITGLDGDIEIEDLDADIDLSLPSALELYEKYGSRSSTIKSLEADLTLSEANSLEAKINYLYPTVSLSGNYYLSGSKSFDDYEYYVANGFSDSGSVTLSVSIPISSYIPGSSGSNAIKNSNDEIAISKINLNEGKKDLLNDINACLIEIRQKKENIALLESQKESAELKYSLSEESNEAGLLTYSDFQDAERSLSDAELSLSSAKCEYLDALYDLSFTLSVSLDELITSYAK